MVSSEDSHKQKSGSKKLMLVRYGAMGYVGWFEHHESKIPNTASHVVIKTDRGLELGEIVGSGRCYKEGRFRCSCGQVEEYYGKGKEDCPVQETGTFVRFGSREDLMEAEHLAVEARKELKTCEKFVEEMDLPMRMVASEHLLGGERIILYFTSDGRVDFRELVRRLAREYQTRIELRQVGSRDEARILADYETCGQPVCCRQFLKILEPVNMRMAKLQKATLDPSKISGHCGRLKCCLRYEDQTYRDLKKRMPRKNTLVRTPKTDGRVIDVQILTQLVMVQDESGNREAWPLDEIEILDGKDIPPRKKEDTSRSEESKDAAVREPDTQEEVSAGGSDEKAEEQAQASSQESKPDQQDRGEKKQDGQKKRRGRRRGRRGRGKKSGTKPHKSKGNGSK